MTDFVGLGSLATTEPIHTRKMRRNLDIWLNSQRVRQGTSQQTRAVIRIVEEIDNHVKSKSAIIPMLDRPVRPLAPVLSHSMKRTCS
jgi:hypothetical protein